MACDCSCNKKSTINANFAASQAVAVDSVFNFPNVTRTGSSIVSNGSGSFTLDNAGLYLIIASVSGAGAAAGNLSIQINSNGALIPGTVQVANSTAVTDIVNLTTFTIVDIPRSCACINNDAVITIVNSGIAGTFVNGSVQIVKLA